MIRTDREGGWNAASMYAPDDIAREKLLMFYNVHHRDLVTGFRRGTCRRRDMFNIAMREPLGAPTIGAVDGVALTVTIVTFIRINHYVYEAASAADRKAIADWTERHQYTPAEAWGLPDFRGRA